MPRVSPDSPRQVPAAATPEWPASASSQMASPAVCPDLGVHFDPSLAKGHPTSNAHVLAHRAQPFPDMTVPGPDLLCTSIQVWTQGCTVRQLLVCACRFPVPVHLGNALSPEAGVHLVRKPTVQEDGDGAHHVDVRYGGGVARHELEGIGALQGVDVDVDLAKLSLAAASAHRTRPGHRSPSVAPAHTWMPHPYSH